MAPVEKHRGCNEPLDATVRNPRLSFMLLKEVPQLCQGLNIHGPRGGHAPIAAQPH